MVANGGENIFSGSIEQVVEGLTSVNYSVRIKAKDDPGYCLFVTLTKSDVAPVREDQSCELYISPDNVVVIPDLKVG